ncbi:glycoside hydrolase family 43 protein [Enemella evansiae]|uniref:glycoside hydrolase family 43 protein n=1 Tax=Enemella evansiae TaxID=2016499 RepID=UPI000B964BBF|nr:glycoside hydrolase family 43 protein [Enemella evansiae]OYO02394.1 glycoside hydrolase 43 family protein [Enemella evansiae]
MIEASNPILPGCHPDPSICRAGEWYYLVSSTFEYLPGLPVLRSRDLVRWETIGHVIDRPGMLDFDGIKSSGGLYAPTIRHGLGQFWVACTLVDPENPSRGGNFLVTASDPAGPWSDPVMLDVEGIDPSIAFDDEGRVWLHGTRLAAEPEWHDQTEVWVREYSPARGALVGDEQVIWRGAVHGAVWAEGPHLYQLDGRWLLIAAEGGTEFHHAVSVAYADQITGPYGGNRANPVFTHRQLGRTSRVIGAGHADLVQAPDGSWLAVMLAMRAADGRHYPLGRETFLCPVVWEDGWPVFAPGEGRLPDAVPIPWAVEDAPPGSWQPDDRITGVVGPADPRWTALRALPAEVAVAEGDAWHLPVRTASLHEASTPAFLGLRQQHADLDVRCTLDVRELAMQESAGLVLRQSERDHVAVIVTRAPDGLRLWAEHCRRGEQQRRDLGALPEADEVELALRGRGYDYTLRCGEVEVITADGRDLDASSTGGFLGLWIGAYATSKGAEPHGAVRITRFTYAPAQAGGDR